MTVGVALWPLWAALLGCVRLFPQFTWGVVTWNSPWGLPSRLLLANVLMLNLIMYVQATSKPTTSALCISSIMLNPLIFPLLTSPRCVSCSSCCTPFFDSVISILLYHHAVYHLTYSGAPPRSETQRLLSVLFKDKARHGDTARARIFIRSIARIYAQTLKYTHAYKLARTAEMRALTAVVHWKLWSLEYH